MSSSPNSQNLSLNNSTSAITQDNSQSQEARNNVLLTQEWITAAGNVINPNIMKKALINYPIIVTKNNKSKEYKIPEIYKGKVWYALNESQKKKVFELWDAIKSEDAGKVDALKLKPKILLVAETIVNAQEAEIVRNRTSQTTANEMFRLTLLMDFPDAKIDWTNAIRMVNIS